MDERNKETHFLYANSKINFVEDTPKNYHECIIMEKKNIAQDNIRIT